MTDYKLKSANCRSVAFLCKHWPIPIAFIGVLLLWVVLFLISDHTALNVIEAKTEFVTFRVQNPEQATINLSGMVLFDGEMRKEPRSCNEDFSIVPGVGSKVTYWKYSGQALQVEILGGATQNDSLGNSAKLSEAVGLVVDENCTQPNRRLPIFGVGTIGQKMAARYDGASAITLSGSLMVYGRSTSMFQLETAGLYPAFSEPILLPPGSQISTDIDEQSSELATLRGFAVIQPAEAFDVRVSTEAKKISVFPPGASTRPDFIFVSFFTRVFNDPVLIQVQVYLFAFFFLLEVGLNLRSAFQPIGGCASKRRHKENDG